MTDCLGCNQIETRPVTLQDGRTVCVDCPDAQREKQQPIADVAENEGEPECKAMKSCGYWTCSAV